MPAKLLCAFFELLCSTVVSRATRCVIAALSACVASDGLRFGHPLGSQTFGAQPQIRTSRHSSNDLGRACGFGRGEFARGLRFRESVEASEDAFFSWEWSGAHGLDSTFRSWLISVLAKAGTEFDGHLHCLVEAHAHRRAEDVCEVPKLRLDPSIGIGFVFQRAARIDRMLEVEGRDVFAAFFGQLKADGIV